MSKLANAAALMYHYQIGGRECMCLCLVHSHVMITGNTVARLLETNLDCALKLLQRLKEKDLIVPGHPQPRKEIRCRKMLEKSWRLRDDVRHSIDWFEATSQAPKRSAAPSAGVDAKFS